MEFYLMRLGSEEKYFLSPERDKFVIGRNNSCDIVFTSPHVSRQHCEIMRVSHGRLSIKNLKASNTTHVDDRELQNVSQYAELRIGCKIGLGVPLSCATGDGMRNANFVFLQLCHSEAEEETYNKELQQAVAFSSRTRARPSKDDPSLVGAFKQQPVPQRRGSTQSEKIASGHPISQPVPCRQDCQRLQSCAFPSQENSSPHSIPSPKPQNTDARPFSASQSQFIQQVPSLQQLPQNRLMVHNDVAQSQNRIQEPLSELHIQKRQNEDHNIVGHQKLHKADKIIYEHVNVYPNAADQSESWRQGRSSNSSHSVNRTQPEPCLAQRNKHLSNIEPEPHQRTHSGEGLCNNIPGSLQKQGSEYEDASERSNQSDASQHINCASNSQNQKGLNKSSFQSGNIHELKPGNAMHRSHQDTGAPHQSHLGHRYAARKHEQSQHPGVAIAKPAAEPISRFDNARIAKSHQSNSMKTGDHRESNSPVPSSCFGKRILSPWEEVTHKTKPSARVAPVQAQFADSVLVEFGSSEQSSGILPLNPVPGHSKSVTHEIVPFQNDISQLSSVVRPKNRSHEVTHYQQSMQYGNGHANQETIQECDLLVEQNVPQPEGNSSKALIMRYEDSDVKTEQSPSSSGKEPLVHRSTPANISSSRIDLTCLPSVPLSSKPSTEETKLIKEEQVGGYSVLTSVMIEKGNEHCTSGKNKNQSKISEVDSRGLQQSRNMENAEEKHSFSILDFDDLDSSFNIDVTQPDPEPMEKTEREKNDKIRIMRHEEDEENFSCEEVQEVCHINDCEGSLSSTELKDVSGKRKSWINEMPKKEVKNNNDNSNQVGKKVWLNKWCMSLNGRPEKDLDGNSDTNLPVQHRKTVKRKISVIHSDNDSSYESFEPDKKLDSETNKVKIIKRDDKQHVSCEDIEVGVDLGNECKGNLSTAELKDMLGKRKRWKEEKPTKEVRNDNENSKQDGKKARLNELSISSSDMPQKDLDRDIEIELPVQHRKTKSKKRLIIDSDRDFSHKSSSESNREIDSETNPSNSLIVKPGGLISTVNDWINKECSIPLKRLPSNIYSDVTKGKTASKNELLDLAVKPPLPEIDCQDFCEINAHTSDKKSVIIIDDDDEDDDDDELPDINIPCIKIDAFQPPLVLSSRSEELKKQTNDKFIEIIGSKGSREKEEDKIKDGKVYVGGKHHKQQNEQYKDNKQDSDIIESRNQGVPQRKNLDLEKGFSCRNKNSSESVPAVEKTDAEQENKSIVIPHVGKSALLPNVKVKIEKSEEPKRKEIQIKKEKVEECEGSKVVIKTETNENSEQASNKAVDDDDDEDIIFMYSQVDETIWVSSDEEESQSPNISFGPMPSSPDLDIEELFREDEEQKLNKDVKNSVSEEIEEEDDDLWFPVLSQSFFSDDDLDFKTSKSISDSPLPGSIPDSPDIKGDDEYMNRPALPESLPGPSRINKASENDDASISPLHAWWPELSQEFSDDDSEMDNAIKDNRTLPGNLKNLDTVIEKLKNRSRQGVQLTDPKMPPPRTKSDNIKKRGKNCKDFYGIHSRQKSVGKSLGTEAEKMKKDLDHERLLSKNQKSKKKSTPPQKRKQKKGPGLRDNLTSKFNLHSYKATVEHKPREKHHRLPEVKVENKKRQSHYRKSHLVTDKPLADENISIQRKNASDLQTQEKPRTKVVAKVTHKTRSQRLIDINLFPSPEISLPKLRKPKYKIPKSSDKSGDKRMESPGDSSAVNTNTVGGISPVIARCDEGTLGSTPSPQPSQPVTEEQKTNDNDQGTRGIIKMDMKRGSASKKIVRFPSKLEELVQELLISPRKNSERAGKLAARAREVLPRELMLQKYHVPPNYMEHFIYHICRWNYDWLEAYRAGLEKQETSGKCKVVRPPPVVTSTNCPTLILYSSYDDYKEIFSNLMYLEIWENIYQDWMKYRQSNMWLPTEIDVVQPAFAGTGTGSVKLWNVKMFTLITHDQSVKGLHPRQGSLISLRIQEGAKRMHMFGHVEHFTKNRKRMVTKELEEACPNGEVCLVMGVQIAKEVLHKVKGGKMISISNVSYIRPSARTWEGLCKLPLSPLCWDILKPSKDVFSCVDGCGEFLVDGMPLNDIQKKAVIEVSNKCIYNQHLPKMSLIHGPPGTGKTRTIIALIAQIVKLSQETQAPFCRILLCAPSNAAVDELTLRLIRLREIGICLRVVRVGVKESINPELKSCTLDAFVQKQIKMELSTPKNVSTKEEWERRKSMVEQAAEDLQSARKAKTSKEVIKQMEVRLTELARSKAEFERSFHSQPTTQERHNLQQKWQYQVLINAEVITTTLGGCISGVMTDVFKMPNNFACCIIDEAGQCKETETWLPLLLGVRKLVLVGDHRQLPATVLSQLAQDKNLKQSLFERLYHRFVIELQLDNIVHSLNIQYRMHPQIAEWPSQHFYMGKLTTNSQIIHQRNCDFKPYIVFDLKTSKEQKGRSNELYNPSEAALVRLIIEVLEPNIGQQKVGVITPYQRQKIHLEEKLAGYFGRLNLVVKTIDAFQGQERDIVILSIVRGNSAANIGFLSQRQRLNVAMTRARKACFVVANLSSLAGNKNWQSLIKNAESRGLVHTITQNKESDKNYIKSILLK